MQKNNKTTYLQNDKLLVPTREAFHKYASHKFTVQDFSTTYPTGNVAQNIHYSIEWTKRLAKSTSFR